MSFLEEFGRRLRVLLRPARFDRELDEEMRLHLELRQERLRQDGLPPEEAHFVARRRFGNVLHLRERSADAWGWLWLDQLVQDVRLGARTLRKSPGFVVVGIAALAIGIGANLTIFGFVNALLLKPLSAADPDRLLRADLGGANWIENLVPFEEYEQYRDRNQSLSNLAMFHPGGILPVRLPGKATEMIHVMPVTGNYFETLGVSAAMGRVITAGDDRPGQPGAIVLSDEGWRRHFDADPRVVGQTAIINGSPFVVLGVAPPDFTGTVSPVVPRIYATWHALPPPPDVRARGLLIGRLKPAIERAAAQADLSRVAAQLGREQNQRISVATYPATTSQPGTARGFAIFGALFMVIAGAVLWVACSNIAILQLARSAARRREMAIRLAIGASRARIIRQVLVENVLLAALGALGAVGLALVTARVLTRMQLPVPMPISLTFQFDWRVAGFAVALAASATLLAGLGSCFESWKTDVARTLLHDSYESSRALKRRSVIMTQVAVSTVLLVTAAALARSLTAPRDRGLVADHVLMAMVGLPRPQYSNDERMRFYGRLLGRLEGGGQVVAASIAETIPIANNRPLTAEVVTIEGRGGDDIDRPRVLVDRVSPGHFQTLGIPLLEGRDFGREDDSRAPAVGIVNRTLATRFWPGESAVGKQLRVGSEASITLIGVARDSKYESLEESPKAFLYRPLSQSRNVASDLTIFVKTSGDPLAAASLIRAQVAEIDPDLAVYNVNTFEARLGLALLPNRAAAVVSGLLGLIAVGLGAIGTYSVMAVLVQQRRREIGIRLALGALPSSVVGFITRQGLRWTAIGLGAGIVAGLAALRLLQGFLYGVSVADPVAIVAVPVLIGAIAWLACYWPASKAAKDDPVAVLRN